MLQVSIVNTTKDYITLRVPRSLMRGFLRDDHQLSEDEALKILKSGMQEYKAGKTHKLVSLSSLRANGHRV